VAENNHQSERPVDCYYISASDVPAESEMRPAKEQQAPGKSNRQ